MEVVACYETPGWADGISEVRDGEERPWFQAQFTGKVLADLHVDPMDPQAGIEAVTGATITSEGATEAARKALQRIIDKTEEAYGAGDQ
jgi:Na+-translocating ferredoxin:NAD+ oxidoreductase RnfG subunit